VLHSGGNYEEKKTSPAGQRNIFNFLEYFELPKCPMEKRNAPELGVLYYYKHFLKIL
jgi:hypothetical protein